MKWLTNPYVLITAGAAVLVYYNGRSRFLEVCKANSANVGNCNTLLSKAAFTDVFLFGLGIKKGGPAGAITPNEIVFDTDSVPPADGGGEKSWWQKLTGQ